MNIKTGLTALAIALTPISMNAQKAVTKATKPATEQAVKVAKSSGNYGKVIIKNSFRQPALKRTPKPEMANLRVVNADRTQVQYDAYGNISEMFNARGQKYREINRDPDGTLTGFVDNTFKKGGAKDTETIYSVGWASDGSGIAKFAQHKYNGNGTATVTHFAPSGEVLQTNNYNTKILNGEEQITTLIME